RHHGDRVRVAGSGHPHVRCDPPQGLSGRARGRRDDRGGVHRHQHVGRRALRLSRPAPETGDGMTTPLSVAAVPPAQARRVGLTVPRVWRAIGAGGVVLVAAVVVAAFAPALAPYDAAAFDLLHRLAPPAWDAGGSWT